MKLVKGLLGLAVFFGILYCGIQFARDNHEAVSLRIIGGWETQDVELWALVLISAAVGAALTFLVFVLELFSVEFGKRRLTRRVKILERELTDLRNMPLSSSVQAEPPKQAEPEVVAQPGDAPST
jgi:uncharacterized membrane protein YciS (DUF1049 family)